MANPMKLTELFTKMATRAGIPATDAKFIEALALIPADADVDDTVANPLSQNLITAAEAEANPKLKNKFTAEALNGIDALLDPVLADFFDAAELEAIKADKATSKKLTKLFEKVKVNKAAAGNPTDTAKALSDLNAEIARIKGEKDTEIEGLKTQHQRERFQDKYISKVMGRTDVIDTVKSFDGLLAIKALEAKLDTVGGQIDYKTGKVMQKADATLPLFLDNKEATVDALLEASLTENNYLKKSDGPAPVTTITTSGGAAAQGQSSAAMANLNLAKSATAK